MKTNGHYSKVNYVIKSLKRYFKASNDKPLFVILLDVIEEDKNQKSIKNPKDEKINSIDSQIEELKIELELKEEYLQSTIEELESTNENLKSSNEELQSLNEELQSTNEEMMTSKEELQSINEELATVNSELQTKLIDLSQINNDMKNLLSGTNIATIFLDLNQNILRFTPTAEDIINIKSIDVGRPIAHIVSNFSHYNNLNIDVQTVLDTLIPINHEVQIHKGNWYNMIIQPYRTLDNAIEGAVITFIDITDNKFGKDKLLLSEKKYHELFTTTNEGIMILDGKTGQILDANPYISDLLGYSNEVLLRKKIWNIGFKKDIILSKKYFETLKLEEKIRYSDLPLETAKGELIKVEFMSNTYISNELIQVQYRIRELK